jgi:hypothetical protein
VLYKSCSTLKYSAWEKYSYVSVVGILISGFNESIKFFKFNVLLTVDHSDLTT